MIYVQLHLVFAGERNNKIWLGYSRRIHIHVDDGKNIFITQISYKIDLNQKQAVKFEII